MVDRLAGLLNMLGARPELARLEGLVRAWELVITAPFRSEEQERALAVGQRRLQTCPVYAQVNVVELTRTCVRLQRPAMAAVTVAFVGGGGGAAGSAEADAKRTEIVAMVRQAMLAMGTDGGVAQMRKDLAEVEEWGGGGGARFVNARGGIYFIIHNSICTHDIRVVVYQTYFNRC